MVQRYVPNLCANIEVVYNPIDVEQWINYDVSMRKTQCCMWVQLQKGKEWAI